MDPLQLARRGAEAGLREITDNLTIISSFKSIFVARAGELYDRENISAELKRSLDKTLHLSSTDFGPSYAGLFVQVHSVFERYISGFTRGCVERLARGVQKYSDLPPHFVLHHNVSAAKALTYIPDGHVNGVTFDFDALMASLAVCFTDQEEPRLTPRVFTISMGNCTPERLDKLFKIVGLPKAFAEDLGAHAAIKGLNGYKGKAGALAKQASNDWAASLTLRNRIVHDADSVPQVNSTDVENLSALTLALIAVFHDRTLAKYP